MLKGVGVRVPSAAQKYLSLYLNRRERVVFGDFFLSFIRLLSGREISPSSKQRVIEISHEMDLVRASKENAANRIKPASNFEEAGPLTEHIF